MRSNLVGLMLAAVVLLLCLVALAHAAAAADHAITCVDSPMAPALQCKDTACTYTDGDPKGWASNGNLCPSVRGMLCIFQWQHADGVHVVYWPNCQIDGSHQPVSSQDITIRATGAGLPVPP